MDISLQSAPFKKDYVAFCSVVLLTLVVILEAAMIIWLPVQFRSEYMWEKQVALQEMIQELDDLRTKFEEFKPASRRQESEARLVSDCLDDLARYTREYRERLSRDQIAAIYNVLLDFDQSYRFFSKGGQYSTELELNPKPALRQIFRRSQLPADKNSKP